MALDFDQLTAAIIENVGGLENISSVTHCVTRLRFHLVDKDKADTEAIKKMPGVLGVTYGMQQYQIILGKNVFTVFNKIENNYSIKTDDNSNENHSEELTDNTTKREKNGIKNVFQNILAYIIGSVTPFITVVYGAGMIRVVLSVITSIWPSAANSPTYMMFNFLALSAFYFMPILIAYGAAKQLKSNPAFVITIVAMLLYPDFVELVEGHADMSMFSIPVVLTDYSQTLLPALLSAYLISKLEKFFYKVIPGLLRAVFAPMFILAVSMPIVVLFLAPIGAVVGQWVVHAFVWVYSITGGLTVGLLAAVFPFIIMSGMNMMFAPVMVQSLASSGFDALFRPALLLHNMAEGGACLGVALKTKNKELKTEAIGCAIGCIVSGVTEPALYGINLRLKKPLLAVMISGAIGGGVAGFLGAKAFEMGYSSILALPIFEGTIIAIIVAVVITIVLSGMITMVLGFDDAQSISTMKQNEAPVGDVPTSSTSKQNETPVGNAPAFSTGKENELADGR
ncbi:PTS beta-glucoside transporter subunit EIIBCA [Lentibacillus populi]|uniref:PTS beta-glucoside transporter subunit EIIBCA n=1 Tax=Lentibacillus populi TaxID=1827502 RepID=A0A9W5X6M5_9BACI|nr:PTS transporter subunit EIIC [Lentibacillus populi]GGB53169.1 PTS beta-glucoside transporter subunit EIIBCA [Lentibacillus populi]